MQAMHMHGLCNRIPTYINIVHPESFKSYAQITIVFARRNRPVSITMMSLLAFIFVCVHLRVLFVIDCVCVRAYMYSNNNTIH